MRILVFIFVGLIFALPGVSATYSTMGKSVKSRSYPSDLRSTYPQGESGSIKSTQQNAVNDQIKETRSANPYYELRLRNDVIYLTPQVCRSLLVRYKTPEDLVYKPGVDVYGKPVRKADINSSPIQAPKSVRIPLRYSKLSQNFNPGPIQSPNTAFLSDYIDEIPLGFLDFDIESGEIKFNRQKLTNDHYKFIRQKCRELME